jgi:predicted nuclease of predicted toxin-antitoxin system
MKIKPDENLSERGAALFWAEGDDVVTVPEENLSGTNGKPLIAICQSEQRCLVTLDLDFSNPLVFQPRDYASIAVLRLPPQALDQALWEACDVLIKGLQQISILGRLWIGQQRRIREY